MTDEEIQQRILNRLPQADWEEASRRAKMAIIKGYTSLGLWEEWEFENDGWEPMEPTIDDLVGVNPKTGLVEFIGV